MYRAVVDPGVLIAATISPASPPARILLSAGLGAFDLLVSPKLVDEFERVLRRPKFRKYVEQSEIEGYLALVHWVGTPVPDPPGLPPLVTPDPGDDYLVALARAARAQFLVSGDPHLMKLKNPDPPVVTPRTFIELLEA